MLQEDAGSEAPRRSSGATLNLVSGVDYEVLEDGDVMLTFVLDEQPAVLESITITDDSATGISDSIKVKSDGSSSGWYTLDGRHVTKENVRKGVYIVNGKKYYNKR